jgi:hypothetical protein
MSLNHDAFRAADGGLAKRRAGGLLFFALSLTLAGEERFANRLGDVIVRGGLFAARKILPPVAPRFSGGGWRGWLVIPLILRNAGGRDLLQADVGIARSPRATMVVAAEAHVVPVIGIASDEAENDHAQQTHRYLCYSCLHHKLSFPRGINGWKYGRILAKGNIASIG